MKHTTTALTAIAFTATLAFMAPIAQADTLRFRLSNGQPNSTFYPFGRATETDGGIATSEDIDIDNATFSDNANLY